MHGRWGHGGGTGRCGHSCAWHQNRQPPAPGVQLLGGGVTQLGLIFSAVCVVGGFRGRRRLRHGRWKHHTEVFPLHTSLRRPRHLEEEARKALSVDVSALATCPTWCLHGPGGEDISASCNRAQFRARCARLQADPVPRCATSPAVEGTRLLRNLLPAPSPGRKEGARWRCFAREQASEPVSLPSCCRETLG